MKADTNLILTFHLLQEELPSQVIEHWDSEITFLL